jgi:hypothetical protein
METLLYCLNILKIENDNEIYRDTLDLVQEKDPKESGNVSNEWIRAIKTIANAHSSLTSSYVFSQSQLSDFLTLSAKGIEEKRMSSQIINNAIFKIYGDIIENYENFSHSLKLNFPTIVVDVISIINQGIDTKGTKVSSIGTEKYYQLRKQQSMAISEEEQKKEWKTPVTVIATSTTTAATIYKERLLLSNKDLVERLAHITNRERKDLEESLARLQDSDLKRISEICRNYRRLQKYSRLIIEGSGQEFRKEIETDLGREIAVYQLGRAANSVKRVRVYIENILDNKFIADVSHGINHVKHNLEYGYQLMNLIERTRRTRQKNYQIVRG